MNKNKIPTAALLALLFSTAAQAETHEVKMLNRSAAGSMVYEPDFVKLSPGDSIRFIATHNGHNAASLPSVMPAGATPFKGKINEQLQVTFDQPGFYAIQCIPHLAMGMVMLVQVVGGDQPAPVFPADLPPAASQRLSAIVQRALLAQ